MQRRSFLIFLGLAAPAIAVGTTLSPPAPPPAKNKWIKKHG